MCRLEVRLSKQELLRISEQEFRISEVSALQRLSEMLSLPINKKSYHSYPHFGFCITNVEAGRANGDGCLR